MEEMHVWDRVREIRQHQLDKWSPEHDLHHTPQERYMLIANYAAAGKYTDAAALCIAAQIAADTNSVKE